MNISFIENIISVNILDNGETEIVQIGLRSKYWLTLSATSLEIELLLDAFYLYQYIVILQLI